MTQNMTHHCSMCGRRFALNENPTLNELRENRVLLGPTAYYHIPCAKIDIGTGASRGSIVNDVSGKLVKHNGT